MVPRIGVRFLSPERVPNASNRCPRRGRPGRECFRDRARRRRGDADALRPSQAAAHDLRPGDGPPRDRRAAAAATVDDRRRRRPPRRAGHGEDLQAGPAVGEHHVRRAVRPARHGRRGCLRHDGPPWRRPRRRVDRCRLARRHATAARRRSTSSSPPTSPTTTRPRCSPRCSTTRRAMGGSSAARTTGCCASSNSAMPAPRSARSAKCARASTPFGATCSALRCATCRPTTSRASTT